MDKKNIVKRYQKDELTIVWEPAKCIHSGICVKMLPEVYAPKAKPWIQQENASGEQLKEQIDTCPSWALSYALESNDSGLEPEGLTVDIMENGPILIKGKLNISHSSGAIETKDKTTAFCRCGASENKPFCDGAHKKIEFKGWFSHQLVIRLKWIDHVPILSHINYDPTFLPGLIQSQIEFSDMRVPVIGPFSNAIGVMNI